MKKKGFTLIELLAVIVILAIIALIATPIILNIITDARDSAKVRSSELVYTGVEHAITKTMYNDATGEVTLKDVYEKLTVENTTKGEEPSDTDTSFTVTTSEGVICTITKETTGFKVECGTEEEVDAYLSKDVQGTGYTGQIYRNSTESIYIGNYINPENRWCVVVPGVANSCIENDYLDMAFNSKKECETMLEEAANSGELDETMQYLVANATCEPGTFSYETNLSNISQNYYLKHDIKNNIVTASYACMTYTENGTRKDVCLRGAEPSYYASNQTILRGVESYFNTLDFNLSGSGKGYCTFFDSHSYCYSDSLYLNAYSDGNVYSYDGTLHCYVGFNGYSYCKE